MARSELIRMSGWNSHLQLVIENFVFYASSNNDAVKWKQRKTNQTKEMQRKKHQQQQKKIENFNGSNQK